MISILHKPYSYVLMISLVLGLFCAVVFYPRKAAILVLDKVVVNGIIFEAQKIDSDDWAVCVKNPNLDSVRYEYTVCWKSDNAGNSKAEQERFVWRNYPNSSSTKTFAEGLGISEVKLVNVKEIGWGKEVDFK